jgi:hypothetical protein
MMTREPAQVSDADADADPVVYDHTVPKPKNAGLAILASLFFFGGGQLVKGHFRRFFALWGIFVGLLVVAGGAAALSSPEFQAPRWISTAAVVGIGVLWFYQLWDAATRP